jgi:hypothetical protein
MLNSDALEIYAAPAPLLAPVVLPVMPRDFPNFLSIQIKAISNLQFSDQNVILFQKRVVRINVDIYGFFYSSIFAQSALLV